MKRWATTGVVAGVAAVAGGLTGVRWLLAGGLIVLLIVVVVLPWLRPAGEVSAER